MAQRVLPCRTTRLRIGLLLAALALAAAALWHTTPAGRPQIAAARAPAASQLTYTGSMDLVQRDGGNCSFSASPLTAGTFDLTIDLETGTASGSFEAGGNGTRQGLRCGDVTGDMVWQQAYGGTFSGTFGIAGGSVTMSGTLSGSGSHRWQNCEDAGEPISCPSGSQGSYSFPIDVTGTVDVVAGSGSGIIVVNEIGLVTNGNWIVDGAAVTATPTVTDTTTPMPEETPAETQTPTATVTDTPTATATNTPTPTSTPTATATPVHDLTVENIEVVQAIQCMDTSRGDRNCADNSIPLVRRKSTAVRVYIKPGNNASPARNVTARLHGFRNGEELPSSPLVPFNRAIIARYPVQRARTNATLNFRLPDDWTFGEVDLRVEVNPDQTIPEQNYSNNSRSQTVRFEPRPVFDVAFVPILYQQPGTEQIREPSRRVYTAHHLMLRQYPIFRINYRQWPSFVWTRELAGDGNPDKLINELNRRYLLSSDAPDQLAGWLPFLPYRQPPSPNVPLGLSNALWGGGQGRVSFQQDTVDGNFTLAHEIGHNLGLRHVNTPDGCNARDPNTDWPYAVATIQEEGFDPITMEAVPSTRFDVMTYCSSTSRPPTNIWVSPHSYRKLFESSQQPRAATVAQEAPYLLVSGTFSRDGFALLEPAYLFSSTRLYDRPPEGDDFCLALQDAERNDLDELCVDVEFHDHVTLEPLNDVGFTFVLPNVDNATRVVVRQANRERAILEASASAPEVEILSPAGGVWEARQTIRWEANDADGDSLSYAVSYSKDDGASWMTLVTNLIEPNFSVDAAELAGSDAARIRVTVSDGMNTTSVDSDPFVVADKAPDVVILTPDEAQMFGADNAIVFTGDGYDLEDGLLPETELIWSSNLDGELGRGTTVTSALSIGDHVITFSAADSQGNRASATVLVNVTESAFTVHLPSVMR